MGATNKEYIFLWMLNDIIFLELNVYFLSWNCMALSILSPKCKWIFTFLKLMFIRKFWIMNLEPESVLHELIDQVKSVKENLTTVSSSSSSSASSFWLKH